MPGVSGFTSEISIALDQLFCMKLKPADPALQILVLAKQVSEHQMNQVWLHLEKLQNDLFWLISLTAPQSSVDITVDTTIEHTGQVQGLEVPVFLERLLDGPDMEVWSGCQNPGILGNGLLYRL